MDTFDYKEKGRGEVLILLHGYGGNPKQWEAVAEAMATQFRVIIPNMAGVLVGEKLVRFSEQVSYLRAFIQTVAPGQVVHIAAASYGGALSWGLAIHAPDLIKSLTLISPMPPHPIRHFRSQYLKKILMIGRWQKALWMFLQLPIARISLNRLAQIFQINWLSKDRFQGRRPISSRQIKILTHVIHRFSQLITIEDWSHWESKICFIEQPVCLIWGEHDRLYRRDEPQRFQKLFSTVELHKIEETGHFSMAENPMPVVYIMDQFLSRLAKSA